MGTFGRKAIVLACAASCATVSTSVGAAVTYNSPGDFFIQTVVNDNTLINNSQAIVTVADPNGVIQGLSSGPAARVQRGTLNMVANARIVAGQDQSAIYIDWFLANGRACQRSFRRAWRNQVRGTLADR
jgi:hypothetical protein